jgi:hypothetical protein
MACPPCGGLSSRRLLPPANALTLYLLDELTVQECSVVPG